MRTFALGVALILAAFVTGAAGADDGSEPSGLANEMCPVMKNRKAKAEHHVVYEGKIVYFCCGKCVARFRRNPTAYLAGLPQFADRVPVDAEGGGDSADATGSGAAPPAESGPGRLTRFLGSFHPVVVHFPIALGLVAALFEVVFLVRGSLLARDAGRLCAVVAGIGAVIAAPLGWLAAESLTPDEVVFHRWAGVTAATLLALAGLLALRAERGVERARLYAVVIVLAAAVVTVAAWSGGVLTFGPDAHAW